MIPSLHFIQSFFYFVVSPNLLVGALFSNTMGVFSLSQEGKLTQKGK